MKVGATWGRGSEAGGPKEGADLAGWEECQEDQACLRRVSAGSRELISELWTMGGCRMEAIGWSRAEGVDVV